MYIDRKFSSLSSSFFKPIVATSLLFLLPSLGMGAATNVGSTACADKGTCGALSIKDKNLTLVMSKDTGGGSTYISYETTTDSKSTPTDTLKITFYKDLTEASFKDSYFSDTSGKGFDLGTGTFTIDFLTQSSGTNRTLNIEAQSLTAAALIFAGKIDSATTASNLKANLTLSGNLLTKSITVKGNAVYTINQNSGDIKVLTDTTGTTDSSNRGNIAFNSSSGSGATLNLDFSSNNGGNIYANVAGTDAGAYGTINIIGYGYKSDGTAITPTTTLYGNFYSTGSIGGTNAKSITLNFKGAKMEGNISTRDNDFLTKNVIFEGTNGSDVVLTGDISSKGVGLVNAINNLDITKGIHAIFKTGSMKGDITTSNSKGRRGYVSAIFLGTDQKLEGSISASGTLADLTVGDKASLTVTGSITSSSGQESVTRVFVGSGASLTVSGSITSGQTGGNAAANSNLVVLDDNASLNVKSLSTTRSGVQVNDKYNNIVISFNSSLDTSKFTDIKNYGGTSSNSAVSTVNSLTVGSISAAYGNIYIGGSSLINLSGNSGGAKSLSDTSKYVVNNAGNLTWTDSEKMANNAFSGKMSLGSITARAGGTTYIAFKADSTQDSSAITGTISNTDAAGKNNIYLDLSKATSLAASQITSGTAYTSLKAGIVGNISTGAGTNNIVLKGSTSTADSSATQLGLAGNITNSSGTTNIVFDDTIWAPSYILNGATVGGTSSGSVSNTGNGTINLVFRQSGSQALSGTSMFNVTNSGKGSTNIVFKSTTTSTLNVGANVNYNDSGSVNILVASGTDSVTTDNFSSTAVGSNKIFGVTYKDGIKFTLKKDSKVFNDATSSVKGVNGSSDVSILTTGTTSSSSVQITGIYTGTVSLLDSSSSSSSNTYTFTLTSGSIFAGSFSATSSSNSTDNLTLVMESGSKVFNASSTLSLGNLQVENATIDTASYTNSVASSNTIIDAGTLGSNINDGFTSASINNAFNLVTINSYSGNNAVFRVRVDGTADQSKATLGGSSNTVSSGTYGAIYADRFVVNAVTSSGSTTTSAYIQPIFTEETDISKITYSADNTNGNIAVFTVKNSTTTVADGDSDNAGIDLKTLTGVQGYNLVSYTLTTAKTNEKGVVDSTDSNNTYTTYFLDSATYSGIAETDMTKSARNSLALGYNLFLANFNSLNKRMGELRNNAHSQGVWGRIFSGMESINFSAKDALSSNTFYTTVQTGYDYAFGFNGANNFIGVALSYANSISDLKSSSISSSYSNAVEFAIYNSYIQDGASKATHWKNGFYNDNILKLSGIFSNADINGSSMAFSQFGITFSEEAGYRFLLGDNNEWYVTPQGELSLGYLTGSGFNYSDATGSLAASQTGIFMLRARVGSDVGYDFKKYTEGKNFDARAYLGLYYTGDYITGGDVVLASVTSQNYVVLNSTSRLVMNLGTNFTIKDQHRVYFDFERSFGGSIVTQYQFNVGYRYSFGESKYTPYSGITSDSSMSSDALREVAPSAGYYIKLFNSSKPSKKELRVLKGIENLKVQVNGDSKDYLIGPFKTEDEARKEKPNYEGTLKEINSKGDVIEVE